MNGAHNIDKHGAKSYLLCIRIYIYIYILFILNNSVIRIVLSEFNKRMY